MQIGTIGLGKMGADMTTYLVNGRHQVVVTDRKPEVVEVETARASGAVPAKSLAELVEKLAAARAVWVIVPSGAPTESILGELAEHLKVQQSLLATDGRKWQRGCGID